MKQNRIYNRLFYCTTLLVLSFFSSASYSQPLDIQWINQYPELIVEYSLHAPPYLLVIGKEEEKQILRYYFQTGDTWNLHHEKETPLAEGQNIFYCQANEFLTVIVYQTPDHRFHFLSLSNTPENSDYDTEPICTSIEWEKVVLQDHSLYILTRQSDTFNFHKITYNENMEREEDITTSWEAGSLFIDDFAVLGDSLLFVYSLSPNVTLPDNTPSPEGIVIGRLQENQQMVFDTKTWFYETIESGDQVIECQPDSVFVNGTTVFITRKFLVPDPTLIFNPYEPNHHELFIVDWSRLDDPQLIQTIDDPVENWGNPPGYKGIDANEQYLVFRVSDGIYTHIAIYQKEDNAWKPMGLLEEDFGFLSLLDNQLVVTVSSSRKIYDLSRLPDLYEVASPANTIFDGLNDFTAFNDRIYYVDNWLTNPQLTALQLSDNHPMVPDSRLPLDDEGYYELATDGTLLAAVSISNPSAPIHIIQLNPNGNLGEMIQSISLQSEDARIVRVLKPLWNNKYFLFPCRIKEMEESTTDSTFTNIVEVRERINNTIGNRIAQFQVTDTVDIPTLLLVDDYLLTPEFRTVEVENRNYSDNILLIHSLQDPAQPELVVEYPLPFPPGSVTERNTRRNQVELAYNPQQQLLAYTDSLRTGLLDLSDPTHPKSIGSFMPGGDSVYWNGDDLAVESTLHDELTFYRFDEDWTATEIKRFGHVIFMQPHFWENTMSGINLGESIGLYRLRYNSSVGYKWMQYP